MFVEIFKAFEILAACAVAVYFVSCFLTHCTWKYPNITDYIELFFLHAYYNDKPLDFEFDAKLRQAILDKLPVTISYAYITIGGITLWGCNWPYAYGELEQTGSENVCPTRDTAKLLREYVKECTGADGDLIDYHTHKNSSEIIFK